MKEKPNTQPAHRTVAIYGAGSGGKLFEKILRGSPLQVIVFFDGDPLKQGQKINGLPVDSPHNEYRYQYDLLIVASAQIYESEIFDTLMEIGVPQHKLVPRSLLSNSIPYLLSMMESQPSLDIFISGMSYHRQGVIPSLSSYRLFNYSQSSLDIYYDYSIAYRLVNSIVQKPSIWVIGLTYYSLQYDMSLATPWKKVFYYKDVFGYHNLPQERMGYYLNNFDSIRISESIPATIIGSIQEEEYNSIVLNNTKFVGSYIQNSMARNIAMKEGKKDHPETVAENKSILNKYVKLLLDHSIQPVFMLVPFPPAYEMNKRIASDFFSFLNEMEKRYDCRTLNGMRLEGYGADCYYDASHLNFRGGKKFTSFFDSFLSKII